MRIGMWNGVSTRAHTPRRVYAHVDELMLYGEVEYGLENGKIVVLEFAARMQFQADKLALYQVSHPIPVFSNACADSTPGIPRYDRSEICPRFSLKLIVRRSLFASSLLLSSVDRLSSVTRLCVSYPSETKRAGRKIKEQRGSSFVSAR